MGHLKRRWIALILGLPGIWPLLAAGQQPTLTLREAIDRAMGQNPTIDVAQANSRVAEAAVSAARAGLFPRLSAIEDISRGNDPVYAFGTRLRQQRFTQADFALNSLNRPTPIGNFAFRLNGQWMLFNWMGTRHQIRSARLGAESAATAGDAARQAVVLEVVQSYQGVLYARRQLEVARHEEQTTEALLHDAETRVKAGLALDSDLLAAQVNLAERRQETISAEGQTENAWAELESAIGGPTDRAELKPLEAKSFPAGVLPDLVAEALKARPDLRALHQQTEAAQQSIAAARSDFLPQVSAYGNWETDRRTFAGDGGNNWVAGVQLSLDILPLGRRAQLATAQAARQKADAQRRTGEQQIRLAVNRAYTGHQTAERMMSTAEAAQEQSAEALRIVRNRYNAGLATMTELLRAEDAGRRSRNDYWRAAYGNRVAYAELLFVTGQLSPDVAEKLQ